VIGGFGIGYQMGGGNDEVVGGMPSAPGVTLITAEPTEAVMEGTTWAFWS
jgi:hypothetical protein